MMNKDVLMVIFSKNRAMQLDLTLNSFYRQCADDDLPNISVLYKADAPHQESYKILSAEHSYVNMVEEKNFKEDLLKIVDNKRYILFVTDDTIFCQKFYISDLKYALAPMHSAIGVSLRLGRNTKYCYPLNKDQKVPAKMFSYHGNFRFYEWQFADDDFGYPLELSSSLYSSDVIIDMLKLLEYKNPNELEALMNLNCGVFTSVYPLLIISGQSLAFANPINRVQNVAAANRFGSNPKYSSESLLTKYMSGIRIDYMKFDKFIPMGCHEEADFEFGENTNV